MPKRCAWVPADQPLYLAYHDEEWGVPVHDDAHLFEMLTLEGAQAGLSWSTILNKREGYRRAFAGFEPKKVARFTPAKVERLLQDPGIVRNRLKVESTVNNAKQVLEMQREHGSLDAYLWSFVGGEPLVGRFKGLDRRVQGHEQGPQGERVPVRRTDRVLRVHAGLRSRERPRRVVLPLRGAPRLELGRRSFSYGGRLPTPSSR
jgi:DNA-3-methyladenine glycosylase I